MRERKTRHLSLCRGWISSAIAMLSVKIWRRNFNITFLRTFLILIYIHVLCSLSLLRLNERVRARAIPNSQCFAADSNGRMNLPAEAMPGTWYVRVCSDEEAIWRMFCSALGSTMAKGPRIECARALSYEWQVWTSELYVLLQTAWPSG